MPFPQIAHRINPKNQYIILLIAHLILQQRIQLRILLLLLRPLHLLLQSPPLLTHPASRLRAPSALLAITLDFTQPQRRLPGGSHGVAIGVVGNLAVVVTSLEFRGQLQQVRSQEKVGAEEDYRAQERGQAVFASEKGHGAPGEVKVEFQMVDHFRGGGSGRGWW